MEKTRRVDTRRKNKFIQDVVQKFKNRLIHEVKTGKCYSIAKEEYHSWILAD